MKWYSCHSKEKVLFLSFALFMHLEYHFTIKGMHQTHRTSLKSKIEQLQATEVEDTMY